MKKVTIRRARAIGRAIHAEPANGATTYATNETAATVSTYGSCVLTCAMWSQRAPAEAMTVVSEIGEQWSPHTAPAMQAEMETIVRGESGIAASTIGMRMPNVAQLVPVENASAAATTKMIAGRKFWSPAAGPLIRPAMNSFAPSESVIVLSVHAQQRIMIAGTIALNPSGKASMQARNETTRRQR